MTTITTKIWNRLSFAMRPFAMQRRRLAAAVAATALFASATAEAACYSQPEFNAEQAIRLHTELMVVGLTCHGYFPGQQVFDQYQTFTTRHRNLLMDWEKSLISHFRKNDRGNPTARFDSFRTEVANEISQRAALLTVPVYCTNQIDVVRRALAMSGDDLRRYAATSGGMRLGQRPLCAPAVAAVQFPEE